jgi:SAM-dependent methyltransferase
VLKLELPDHSFDRVRTDRVLMFVREIEQALAEIFRVLRPGGVLVASEIDFETYFFDSPLAEISRKFTAAFAESNVHPRLGRQLSRLMIQAGFGEVQCIPMVLRNHYPRFRRAFGGFLRSWLESGGVTEAELKPWLQNLEQAHAGGFFNQGVIVFTVRGQKI